MSPFDVAISRQGEVLAGGGRGALRRGVSWAARVYLEQPWVCRVVGSEASALRAPPVHALRRSVARDTVDSDWGRRPLTGRVVVAGPARARVVVIMTGVAGRIGNVTGQRYAQLVTRA